MKLTFSPASPFARKVRIAAIELGLIDKIEFVPTTVVPGQANDEYAKIYPLKKLPARVSNHLASCLILRDAAKGPLLRIRGLQRGANGAFAHPAHADLQCSGQSVVEFTRALFHEASKQIEP